MCNCQEHTAFDFWSHTININIWKTCPNLPMSLWLYILEIFQFGCYRCYLHSKNSTCAFFLSKYYTYLTVSKYLPNLLIFGLQLDHWDLIFYLKIQYQSISPRLYADFHSSAINIQGFKNLPTFAQIWSMMCHFDQYFSK